MGFICVDYIFTMLSTIGATVLIQVCIINMWRKCLLDVDHISQLDQLCACSLYIRMYSVCVCVKVTFFSMCTCSVVSPGQCMSIHHSANGIH